MTTISHAKPNDKFIDIKCKIRGKKIYRTNQDSNFLSGSLSNGDKVSSPIQFKKEKQSQNLKREFFIMGRPIHFHINNTRVIQRSNETCNKIRLFVYQVLSFPYCFSYLTNVAFNINGKLKKFPKP